MNYGIAGQVRPIGDTVHHFKVKLRQLINVFIINSTSPTIDGLLKGPPKVVGSGRLVGVRLHKQADSLLECLK